MKRKTILQRMMALVVWGIVVLAGGTAPCLAEEQKTAPPGETKREFVNSLGMKFLLVKEGSFMMGPKNHHQVTLTKPFYLQVTEVTQGQWTRIMGKNPSFFKACGENCPVERVSWDDVQEFIRRLNALEKTDNYRLPTEAEWEYVCRAGSKTLYCFGQDPEKLGEFGWYQKNAEKNIHPVGQKKPNPWGFYDMYGNVWEWCQDWYDEFPTGAVTDPKGPPQGTGRVIRGGSWCDEQNYCCSCTRVGMSPRYAFNILGFRLVRNY